MSETLFVNEIFLSLQGESTFAGLPCVFIRLAGCNLRCSYCDTAYAFDEGTTMALETVLARVKELTGGFAREPASTERCPPERPGAPKFPLVELTGGEPLLQKGSLPLMKALCDAGHTVLLETNGALDIAGVDPRVRRIVDLKCPGSGESHRNYWPNLEQLRSLDEIKCVIGSTEDYEWAKKITLERRLAEICPVLFSWAAPLPEGGGNPLNRVPEGQNPLSLRQLAERITADGLPVRFQLQLHKFIWPPDQRGV